MYELVEGNYKTGDDTKTPEPGQEVWDVFSIWMIKETK